MELGATLAGAATSGLASAVTGGIGSIVSGGLGLLGSLFKKNNNGLKNQQKLMQHAWEYEKEGMVGNTSKYDGGANISNMKHLEQQQQLLDVVLGLGGLATRAATIRGGK